MEAATSRFYISTETGRRRRDGSLGSGQGPRAQAVRACHQGNAGTFGHATANSSADFSFQSSQSPPARLDPSSMESLHLVRPLCCNIGAPGGNGASPSRHICSTKTVEEVRRHDKASEKRAPSSSTNGIGPDETWKRRRVGFSIEAGSHFLTLVWRAYRQALSIQRCSQRRDRPSGRRSVCGLAFVTITPPSDACRCSG